MQKAADPYFFMKNTAGGIIGTNTPARLPSFSKQVDWEAELGVVIGKQCRHVSEAKAFDVVAGYLICQRSVGNAPDLMKLRGLAVRHGLGRTKVFRGRCADGAVVYARGLHRRSQ